MSTLSAVLAGEARWCVIEGDCIEVMAGMGDGCVDHVITDPPYSEHVHHNGRRGSSGWKGGICESRDLGFCALTKDVMEGVSDSAARLVKRWALVFCNVEASQAWASDLSLEDEPSLRYVRTGAWVKRNTTPQFTGDRPAQGHEAIVACHAKGRMRWNGGGRPFIYEHAIVIDRGAGETRVHTTQKPLALMLDLVRDFTDPNDLILDPFCGSGTTGVAALKLGRRAILIEKDPKYAEIARQRMRDTEEEIAAENGEVRAYTKPRQLGLLTGANK